MLKSIIINEEGMFKKPADRIYAPLVGESIRFVFIGQYTTHYIPYLITNN